jgi:hypothetical protein
MLRPLLRDSGAGPGALADVGPKVERIRPYFAPMAEIEARIVAAVAAAYANTFSHAQFARVYFPVFQLGECWSPMTCVTMRAGAPYDHNLVISDGDESIFEQPDDQPVIDFEIVRRGLQLFQEHGRRVGQLRPGEVRGAL